MIVQHTHKLSGWANGSNMGKPKGKSHLDLLLVDDESELKALTAQKKCCPRAQIETAFYQYLDSGALLRDGYQGIATLFDLPSLHPGWDSLYAFSYASLGNYRDIGRTIGPGSVPYDLKAMWVIVENSRHGIRTELPNGFCKYWRRLLSYWREQLLVVSTVDDADRLWFDPATLESREDYNDSIIKATSKGIVRYMHDDTLCDELRMLDFEWMEDLDRMEKAIDIAVQSRRSGMADRAHLTLLNESAYQEWRPTDMGRKKGECRICLLDTTGGTFPAPPEYQLPLTAPFGRFAGWRIFNRMRTQISLEDYPFIPFDARYPCIYTITHSIYGRWKAIESAYDWYMDYWDIVAGLRNDLKGRRSISWTLIVDVPQPLVEPEKALQKKCYGIAINKKEKTIELTEDADALAMFRPAVKGLRAFRHR